MKVLKVIRWVLWVLAFLILSNIYYDLKEWDLGFFESFSVSSVWSYFFDAYLLAGGVALAISGGILFFEKRHEKRAKE
ncbi:hypothetical protein I7Z51_004844 [Vibrio parahaemolyticus]|uniref:hypothetical protein n=1 Tax=Vibrio TaxID=662 RepID=UPI00046EE4E6|nr:MULTISPECIES: hypothetical protein [Vibrio]EGQ7975838.1 hypothetical protein [Vibrio parahaemolyticus]EGQ9221321.1 hypothetical protein [Vibrio parahaemolyticus]EJE4690874.1 hypothetical protein [Vibrio parahaemolyticus]EJK2426910.1 hypothetical protein [Vibrio parahaemolyticus]ELB2063447.1 hypothetical protein [Vibrio parahaemolyticus]